MAEAMIYPLTFEPQLRDYIWGGRNLETLFGRELPPGPTAESWEISAHPEAPTVVNHGYWQGHTLPEVLDALGTRLAGSNWPGRPCDDRFPLLIKLLDAQRDLSVQVHPDDVYACAHEADDPGKTECWVILAAEPGSELIYGLAEGVDRETFAEAIAEGTVAEQLAHLPVEPGDCVFVPAGTVHAVTSGVVLAEIQQNSDATYRIYDWDRLGDDGQPRELHIEKALDVIDWQGSGPGIVDPTLLDASNGLRRSLLVACPQFVLEEILLMSDAAYQGECTGETFEIWGCLEGTAEISWSGESIMIEAVQFVLLPAVLGAFAVTAQDSAKLLRVFLGPQQ